MTRGLLGPIALSLGLLFATEVSGQTAAPTPAPARAAKSAPQPASPSTEIKSANANLPSAETMLALVRTHILALDHALRTNNFYVLHALGGPFLQSRLTPEQLAQAFANLKADRPDLAAVAIMTPVLTVSPEITASGMLQMVGQFPTKPKEIRFEMVFQPSGGEWRLAGMNIVIAVAPMVQSTTGILPTAPRAQPVPGAVAR